MVLVLLTYAVWATGMRLSSYWQILKNCSRSKRETKIDNLETEEKYLLITSSEMQFNHKKVDYDLNYYSYVICQINTGLLPDHLQFA